MGAIPQIRAGSFPRQSPNKGKRVAVRFHSDPTEFHGTCIRDDFCLPFVTIFHLDNGRVILSTECRYKFLA